MIGWAQLFLAANEKNNNSITEQLNEIRKTSIARIICDNTKIQQIQPMAFRQVDDEVNFLVACEDQFFKNAIPKVDLSVFWGWGEIKYSLGKCGKM